MTKAEQARLVAWRLKVLQHAGDGERQVAQTCRHFGISRPTFYKWKKRFQAGEAAGLCDRPRAPHRSPGATAQEVVSKILYLRQTYHFGAGRIADYLKRFHEISIARSSVHRLLGKHGMGRLPANQKHRPHKQRWTRYEKPQPGHRLQLDVKFLERIPQTRFASGRTITITTDRTGASTVKRRTSDSWQKRELECQQRLRTLQVGVAAGFWGWLLQVARPWPTPNF